MSNEGPNLIRRSKFQFNRLGESLIAISAGSGKLWLAVSGRQILWHAIPPQVSGRSGSILLPSVDEVTVLPQQQPGEEIKRLFASPTGAFCLATTTANNVYFCSTGLSQRAAQSIIGAVRGGSSTTSANTSVPVHSVRQVVSLKGKCVNCVAWPSSTAEAPKKGHSGPVLLGLDTGEIFEVAFAPPQNDPLNFSKVINSLPGQLAHQMQMPESYCESVYKLNDGIVGIHYSKAHLSDPTDGLYCVVVVTAAGYLYQFVDLLPSAAVSPSTSVFPPLFRAYPQDPSLLSCATSPPAPVRQTPLSIYFGQDGAAQQIIWLAAHGLYSSQFDFANSLDSKMVLSKQKLIRIDKSATERLRASGQSPAGKIVGIGLGQFHALLVHEHSVLAYNLLSEKMVEEDVLLETTQEAILGSDQDSVRHTLWFWTRNYIYYFDLVDEDRDIWRHYLERGDFEKAKKWCRNDKAKLNRVLVESAKAFYVSGQYVKCAQFYAESQEPIESVVPDLMALPDQTPLRAYLQRRLELLPTAHDSRLAQTTIILWVIDIYLAQLADQRERGKTDFALRKDFEIFIARRDVIDALTTLGCRRYDLFLSQGDRDAGLRVAELVRDWPTLCDCLTLRGNYAEALNVIERCHTGSGGASREGRLLLHAPCLAVLLRHMPSVTLKMLRDIGAHIRPKTLVMTLVQLEITLPPNSQIVNDIVEYLEFCSEKMNVRDPSLHNYLMSLYAKFNTDKLLAYLRKMRDEPKVPFDVDFAISCCERLHLNRALILLYPLAGRYEDAIEAAMAVDLVEARKLAKQFDAGQPQIVDLDTRKRIWLTVAQEILKHNEQKGIETALDIVRECDRVIGIEDIMPFFTDAVSIDDFKEAILSSLTDFKERVANARDQLDSCAKSAEQISRDLTGLRQVALATATTDRCNICRSALHLREFYVFPCGHSMHRQCSFRMGVDMAILAPAMAKRVEEYWSRPTSGPSAQQSNNTLDQIDRILGAECLLCGDIGIRCLDTPFVSMLQLPDVNHSWL